MALQNADQEQGGKRAGTDVNRFQDVSSPRLLCIPAERLCHAPFVLADAGPHAPEGDGGEGSGVLERVPALRVGAGVHHHADALTESPDVGQRLTHGAQPRGPTAELH